MNHVIQGAAVEKKPLLRDVEERICDTIQVASQTLERMRQHNHRILGSSATQDSPQVATNVAGHAGPPRPMCAAENVIEAAAKLHQLVMALAEEAARADQVW